MQRRIFLAGSLAGAFGAEAEGVRVEPERPFPGSPVLFSVAEGPVSGTWQGRPVTFGLDEGSKRYVALAAVGLEVKPGLQELRLGGRVHPVTVVAHAYRTGKLTVPPQFVQPPKAVTKRLERERAAKSKVFAERGPRLWAGAFAAPTDTAQTSGFGTRRTYNGKTRSIHQGLDFRAAVGTPIQASNAGRVAIAEEMYYEGGFVVLDHGEGLFTLYMHLSKFAVAVGDVVKKGQKIAASGGSGRVTGPHLHFGVQWQGLYMEPATLLKLRFG